MEEDRFGTGHERYKRSYSNTMPVASAQEDDSSDSLFVSPAPPNRHADDDHYNNGHDNARRRLHLPTPPVRRRPGDGLDHRRPVVFTGGGANAAGGPVRGSGRSGALSEIIDLTDGDRDEELATPPPRAPQAQVEANFEEEMEAVFAEEQGAGEEAPRAQRGPRFGRDIIDIVDSDDEEVVPDVNERRDAARATLRQNGQPPRPHLSGLHRPGHLRQPSPPMADEFQITGERTASGPQTVSRQPTPVQPRGFTPVPGQAAVDLTQDDDDDVIHVNTTVRERGVNAGGPVHYGGHRAASAAELNRRDVMGGMRDLLGGAQYLQNHIARRLGVGVAATANEEIEERALAHLERAHAAHAAARTGELARLQGVHRHHHHAHGHHHHHHHHPERPNFGLGGAIQHFGIDIAARERDRREQAAARLGMQMNMGFGMMDYGEVAFDMGMGGNRPKSPEYKAPPPPDEGFTRSPQDDDVVVCPNCGDELAVGEGDVKQQVWVVKSCGHAYCGECAEKRNVKTPRGPSKGKAPVTDPKQGLKKCVVEKCGKPLTTKGAMIHIYMSS